jgi:hypothetical protein
MICHFKSYTDGKKTLIVQIINSRRLCLAMFSPICREKHSFHGPNKVAFAFGAFEKNTNTHANL